MKISNGRYEEIKEVVAMTLQLGKVYKLPICPYALAHSIDIQLIPYSTLSEVKRNAAIEFSNEGFTLNDSIYYNDSMYEKRTRFTIMHEIGHIMLNHNTENDLFEIEANFFARYILAPPVLISANDNTQDMSEFKIGKIFNVSNEISGYIYSDYQYWSAHLNQTFPINTYDLIIFNLFYSPTTA